MPDSELEIVFSEDGGASTALVDGRDGGNPFDPGPPGPGLRGTESKSLVRVIPL